MSSAPGASPEIFGGIFLPGTQYVALERVLAAHSVFREEAVVHYWQRNEALSRMAIPLEGPRIWFRVALPDGDVGYVSLHPGEYRTTPPDPPCEIRELPLADAAPITRDMLRAARRNCRHAPPRGSREALLLAAADRILDAASCAGSMDGLARIAAAARNAGEKDFQRLLAELQEDPLLAYQTHIVELSYAQLLLQLQRVLGLWIEEPWHENPHGYLDAYVDHIAADPSRRESLQDAMVEGAGVEERVARGALKSAIESESFEEATGHLVIAYSHFVTALWLAERGRKLEIPEERFSYSASVAEEALVCSLSAITHGARFCTKHPEHVPRELLAEAGADLVALRKAAREMATHVFPYFTRTFADLLAAHALTLAEDSRAIGAGIAELERAQGRGGLFESRWIDQALLSANKRIGDEEQVRRYAVRIAANALIEARLARPDQS